MEPDQRKPPGRWSSFEDHPLTRPEYFNVMTHFYRGELQRAMVWRERLDTTTNWAVLSMAGVLSYSFSGPGNSHVIILLSNFIMLFFLLIEARRYRYFEVYRARVRLIEENTLIPIINRNLESPMRQWRQMITRDLHSPKFKSTMLEAIGFRLRRNYLFVFSLLFGAWWLKLSLHPTQAYTWQELYARMSIGWIPSGVVLAFQGVFILALAAITARVSFRRSGIAQDEIQGLEPRRARFKF
ncbi:MAG TPA: DUF2270 domain-containing protein [Woeseiaceae bacterium]|nr:DUF2270 domain-containing protein [Woeseiaceae bacterium]